jgi:hypothetical protein
MSVEIQKRLEDASQDELLAVVDSCERLFWSRFHHYATDEEWDSLRKTKERVVNLLQTKYGLDNQGIRQAWTEWNERTLRQEWDASFCSQCPRSPGYESYRNLGGALSCENPRGSGGAMIYRLPRTKEECIWERDK